MGLNIGVARGPRAHALPQVLAYRVILCFNRRYPKQNSVACLKSKILPPPPHFWAPTKFLASYATVPEVTLDLKRAVVIM